LRIASRPSPAARAIIPSARASKAFALGAPVEIAADGRFVAVEEPQGRDDQPDRLEQQPDRQQQDNRQNDRNQRCQRELAACHRQERHVVHFCQEADAKGEPRDDGNEIRILSKDQSMLPPPSSWRR
jgi:hypothetical protein